MGFVMVDGGLLGWFWGEVMSLLIWVLKIEFCVGFLDG